MTDIEFITAKLAEIEKFKDELIGMGAESKTNAIVFKLSKALAVGTQALKNECHCTGEYHTYSGEKITCYACDSISQIREILK